MLIAVLMLLLLLIAVFMLLLLLLVAVFMLLLLFTGSCVNVAVVAVVVVVGSCVVSFFVTKKDSQSGRKLEETPTHQQPQGQKNLSIKQATNFTFPNTRFVTYQEVYSQTSPVCFCDQTHPVCCPGKVLLTASNFSDDFCLANKTPRNL